MGAGVRQGWGWGRVRREGGGAREGGGGRVPIYVGTSQNRHRMVTAGIGGLFTGGGRPVMLLPAR